MQKRTLIAFLVFFSMGWILPVLSADPQEPALRKITFPTGTAILAEVADTLPKRELGLMFRKSLAKDRGMLFTFEHPGLYHFWMKNCRLSLDIIWLDQKKRIVHIESNVPPCLSDPCPTYGPAEKTSYVIETVDGFANENGLRPGLEVKFSP